jgi:hypothetical protein
VKDQRLEDLVVTVRCDIDNSALKDAESRLEKLEQADLVDEELHQSFTRPVFAINAGERIRSELWRAYLRADAPYGKHNEGMMRWARENK